MPQFEFMVKFHGFWLDKEARLCEGISLHSSVSVVRVSVVSPTRLSVQLVQSHPEYFTWRCMEDYFHLYVPLSSTSKFLSPDVDV